MWERLGVRGRLLLAFFGISSFAVLSALAAMYAFVRFSDALEGITQERVPAALAALELSRQAERIVAAAPALLTLSTAQEYEDVSKRIRGEVDRLNELLSGLGSTDIDPDALASIEALIKPLVVNLINVDAVVFNNLNLGGYNAEQLRELADAYERTQQELATWIQELDNEIVRLREALDDPARAAEWRAAAASDLIAALTSRAALQTARNEVSTVYEGLLESSSIEDIERLSALAVRLRSSMSNFEILATGSQSELPPLLRVQSDRFSGFIEGPTSVIRARERELNRRAGAELLLSQNADLSHELTLAVDRLLTGAKRDIQKASLEAESVQRLSSGFLIAVVALSIASSAAIVWLYVDRNLIARLRALSDSMLAIAGGDLSIEIPAGGKDEISRMANALLVFRDTAIEVRDTNIREVQEARRLLSDAVESVSEGFAIYDHEDRLVLCNRRYREIMYPPGAADFLVPGTPFETIARTAAERGLIPDAVGRVENWVAERLARHRNPGAPMLLQRAGGRWVQVNERKTESGGTVSVYTDVTDVRSAELELRRYIASLGHELRSPLNSIIGFTRLVMRRTRDVLPAKQYDNLKKARVSADQLLLLIDDILEISRIESKLVEVNPVEVPLAALVDQCLLGVEHEPNIRDGRITLANEVPAESPPLFTGVNKLRQVLGNLVNNAVRYTDEGTVTVSARLHGKRVLIAIADTGIGIAEDMLEEIFREFRQAGDAGARRPGSTGLGLAISRRLARLLGGDIAVESEVGKGSTFTLTIPLHYAAIAVFESAQV